VTSSAAALVDVAHGRPLRVATLAAHPGTLERATVRAVLAAGVEVVVSLGTGDPRSFGERAQALRDARPDLVLVALADRGDADRLMLLAEPLRFGCAAQRPPPRVIVASGAEGAIARARTLLAPFAVEVVPDLSTDDGRRRIVARLRELRRAGGLLRDEALETLARRIAEVRRAPALVVDVSGSSTSLVHAEPNAPLLAAHARPLGIGRGADHVVSRAGLDRVRRWIPWAVDQPTLLERVFNRARWPDAVPTDRETRGLEVALAHEAIAHALADTAAGIGPALRSPAIVVLTGRLGALGPEHAVLVAIDALELSDPASIARDQGDDLVRVAASVASGDHAPLDDAIRERLAPLAGYVPVATARRSLLQIVSAAGAREERVDRGAFFVLRIEGGAQVAGPGVAQARLETGTIGLVVDARPRPLELPQRDAERVPTVARWYGTLGGLLAEAAAG
jgi:hypothetical protein